MAALKTIFGTLLDQGAKDITSACWAAALNQLLGGTGSIADAYQRNWYRQAELLYEAKVKQSFQAEEFNMGGTSTEVLQRFYAMVRVQNPDVTDDEFCTLFAFGAVNSTMMEDAVQLGLA